MAPSDWTFSSSPVLIMPPPSVHQIPFDKPLSSLQTSSFSQSSSWPQTEIQSSQAPRGRKRSRDEAAPNLDPPEKVIEPPTLAETEEEWVYGPGMNSIKPDSRYVIDASSQSGTWVEEKAAEEDSRESEAAHVVQERLSSSSHTSQQLGMAAVLIPRRGTRSNRSSPTREIANPKRASSDSIAQPIVDDFTLHLGIGWSRIGDNEHIQAAARGWARYIENHYPITDAVIRLESRGLQSYLVEANEGFFLFAESLHRGRLVSKDAERTLQNLKASPPIFDGPETMVAAETPRSLETTLETAPDFVLPTAVPPTTMDTEMG
jgi:hypothetical protein